MLLFSRNVIFRVLLSSRWRRPSENQSRSRRGTLLAFLGTVFQLTME